MSIDRFNPTIWSSKILQNFLLECVYVNTCNRDYEGDISAKGNRVKIHGIGAVNVFDVEKNTPIPAPQILDDSEIELVIDQQKGFNFAVDDIDAYQQDPKVMGEASREAAAGIAAVADTYVASLYTGVDAANVVGSVASPIEVGTGLGSTKYGNAYDLLVELKIKLDKAKVPAGDRTVVVPSEFEGAMSRDNRFVLQAADGTDFRNSGSVYRAAGFTVVVSQNVPQTGTATIDGNEVPVYAVQASHKSARTFASQITKVEAFRPHDGYQDALKGLNVYGAKLVRPTAMAVAHVAFVN